MWTRRLTLADLPRSLGSFKPVGHVMIALPDAAQAAATTDALCAEGFDEADILHFDSSEGEAKMHEMIGHSGDFAGFGYEITLVRRYQALAKAGHCWLLVYAPEDDETERVTEVARRFKSPMAVKYHRYAVEDMV